MNHAGGGDTESMRYIHISDDQLRGVWQAVADFIEKQGSTKRSATA